MRNMKWKVERNEEHEMESRKREREQGTKNFNRKTRGRERTSCCEEKIDGPDVV